MAGLWRKDPTINGPKYVIQRRDGTVPEWPWFVLGARDPAAPAALRAYAYEANRLGMDPVFVQDIRDLANEFERYRQETGSGDPDAPPHRKDNPEILARLSSPAITVRGCNALPLSGASVSVSGVHQETTETAHREHSPLAPSRERSATR